MSNRWRRSCSQWAQPGCVPPRSMRYGPSMPGIASNSVIICAHVCILPHCIVHAGLDSATTRRAQVQPLVAATCARERQGDVVGLLSLPTNLSNLSQPARTWTCINPLPAYHRYTMEKTKPIGHELIVFGRSSYIFGKYRLKKSIRSTEIADKMLPSLSELGVETEGNSGQVRARSDCGILCDRTCPRRS